MQHDSQYPANWMPDVIRMLPKQTIAVVPAGAGVGVMKEEYGQSLQILLAVCGLVLLIACANVANLLLARAVARRTQTAVRLAVGATRMQIVAQALVESVLLAVAGGIAGLLVAMGAAQLLLSLAFSNSHFLPISTRPSLLVLAFAFGSRAGHGSHLRRGACVVCDAHRSGECAPRVGTQHQRSFVVHAHGAARRAGDVVRRARRRRDDAGAQPEQARTSGLRISATGTRRGLVESPAGGLHAAETGRAVPRDRTSAQSPARSAGIGLALYNPLTDNWGELILVAGHPAPKLNEQGERVVGPRERQLPAELRHDDDARAGVHRRGQRNDGAGRHRQRDVREAILQERRRSARSALRTGPSGERRHVQHHRRGRATRNLPGMR